MSRDYAAKDVFLLFVASLAAKNFQVNHADNKKRGPKTPFKYFK